MSRISVIRSDNVVVIDGEAHTVDCSSLPENVHAIQWYGGYVEFVDADPHDGKRDPSERIDNLAPYQHLIEAWKAAKAARILPDAAPLTEDGGGLHVLED